MLEKLGVQSINDLLIDIPPSLRLEGLQLPSGLSELETMAQVSALANRNKAKFTLAGVIKAGATATFTLPVDVPLSNDGGLISLLDASGLKVHGVSYTKAQAARQGWTVAF